MENPLDQTVFILEDDRTIRESTLLPGRGYIEETTTPYGIGPVHHVRGTELWAWGPSGSSPRRVSSHHSEAEAEAALAQTFLHDFWASQDITAFLSRSEAERALADCIGLDINP